MSAISDIPSPGTSPDDPFDAATRNRLQSTEALSARALLGGQQQANVLSDWLADQLKEMQRSNEILGMLNDISIAVRELNARFATDDKQNKPVWKLINDERAGYLEALDPHWSLTHDQAVSDALPLGCVPTGLLVEKVQKALAAAHVTTVIDASSLPLKTKEDITKSLESVKTLIDKQGNGQQLGLARASTLSSRLNDALNMLTSTMKKYQDALDLPTGNLKN